MCASNVVTTINRITTIGHDVISTEAVAKWRNPPREKRKHPHTNSPLARAGSAPVSRRNDRFRFREIPTVTSFPRNDKLLGRVRCLITFIRFYPKRTPVPPCHCEERNARRGNLPEGKTYLRTRPPQILARAGSAPRNPPREKWKQSYTITKKHPPKHPPAQDLRPYGRNGTPHTRASPLARGGSPPSGSATLTETTRAVRFTFSRKYVIIRKTQRQKRKTKSAE